MGRPSAKSQFAKMPAFSGKQNSALNEILSSYKKSLRGAEKGLSKFQGANLNKANALSEEAAQGYRQFLPGGGGGEAIANAAQNRFKQQTIPDILNAYGSDAKTSSALNQALAAGASNLNTDIASQLAQMQLVASQGIGNVGAQRGQLGLGRSGQQLEALKAYGGLGIGQAQIGLGASPFGYAERSNPFWQNLLMGGIGAGGNALGGFLR